MTRAGAATELVIVAEVDGSAPPLAVLTAALTKWRVASVILAPPAGGTLEAAALKPLVEAVQQHGVAALVSGDARLARTLKADGVHLPWSPASLQQFQEAREILGSRFIVGADAGRSRDDAMSLGEQGADYIAFAIPRELKEQAKARERRLELIGWWSEIFQVPGMALDVVSPAEAEELAEAGCEFLGLDLPAIPGPDGSQVDTDAIALAIGAAMAAA